MLQKSQNSRKYPCDSFREVGSHIEEWFASAMSKGAKSEQDRHGKQEQEFTRTPDFLIFLKLVKNLCRDSFKWPDPNTTRPIPFSRPGKGPSNIPQLCPLSKLGRSPACIYLYKTDMNFTWSLSRLDKYWKQKGSQCLMYTHVHIHHITRGKRQQNTNQ